MQGLEILMYIIAATGFLVFLAGISTSKKIAAFSGFGLLLLSALLISGLSAVGWI